MAMAAGDEEAVFHLESTIRGHHVYKTIWTPTVGEALQVVQEPSNSHDAYAVAILRDGSIVGHAPREIRRILFTFLIHGSDVSCEVIGHRKYGKGLEIPCLYRLKGKEEMIMKAKKKLDRKKKKN